jgi:hypothetical protein
MRDQFSLLDPYLSVLSEDKKNSTNKGQKKKEKYKGCSIITVHILLKIFFIIFFRWRELKFLPHVYLLMIFNF